MTERLHFTMQTLKRSDTNELIYKTEIDSKNEVMVARGWGGIWGERIFREFRCWDGHIHTAIFKMDN